MIVVPRSFLTDTLSLHYVMNELNFDFCLLLKELRLSDKIIVVHKKNA